MSKARKTTKGRPGGSWAPLQRATRVGWTDEKRQGLLTELRQLNMAWSDDELVAFVAREEAAAANDEVWMNHVVVCSVERREDDHSVECISIRRQDRKALHDWRVMQQIKNELAGWDSEAVELYPAADRLVDTANQYWLWCGRPGEWFPFGFTARAVTYTAGEHGSGAVQRPLDPGMEQVAQ